MSDKSKNILVQGGALMILIAPNLIGGSFHFKAALTSLEHLFAEKWFDIVLALLGTWLGYLLARRHIEHLMSEIVKALDKRYLKLFQQRSFHRAVSAMLTELPDFYLRPTNTFSTQTADAISEFTHWSAALDPTHTPEKSMKMVGKEAYTLAAGLIERDLGFKEAQSTPNYEWIIDIANLPVGWAIDEVPDLSIYNWDTGIAVYRHATMEEINRTATSVRFNWKWNMKDVPCGVYVGTVNFRIGHILNVGASVGERLRVFLKREGGQIIKLHESIPWD